MLKMSILLTLIDYERLEEAFDGKERHAWKI